MYSGDARATRPIWLQTLVALVCVVALAAAYVVLMRLTLDASRLSETRTAGERDTIYLLIHGGLLVLAAIGGFLLGKWLNGLGLAYAVLFVAVLAVFMVAAQAASHELACEGHNDLIRHWTC